MSKEPHAHKFTIPVSTHVALRPLVHDEVKKKYVLGAMTGKDKLLQRKCKCGATETYDLERTVV